MFYYIILYYVILYYIIYYILWSNLHSWGSNTLLFSLRLGHSNGFVFLVWKLHFWHLTRVIKPDKHMCEGALVRFETTGRDKDARGPVYATSLALSNARARVHSHCMQQTWFLHLVPAPSPHGRAKVHTLHRPLWREMSKKNRICWSGIRNGRQRHSAEPCPGWAGKFLRSLDNDRLDPKCQQAFDQRFGLPSPPGRELILIK